MTKDECINKIVSMLQRLDLKIVNNIYYTVQKIFINRTGS